MNAKIGSVQQTNYMFRSFKVPDDITDGSMIGFNVVQDSGPSKKMLHHLLFYGCKYDKADRKNAAAFYQNEAKEGDSQLGNAEGGCHELLYVWAVGNPAVNLPADVGFSVGTDTKARWTHYLIEFHYHNENLEQNVVDNSGIRVTYSKVRKSQEAGILTIGDSVVTSGPLPAGQKYIQIQKSC